jgi:hypothetical protein
MTSTLPPEQSAIDRAMLDELFEIVPDEWDAFLLSIEPRKVDGGGQIVTIVNPDVDGAKISPTAGIRAQVAKLVAFLAREKRAWERLTYAAHADEAGTWRVKITVPLPPPAPAPAA